MGYKKPLEVKLQLTTACNYNCNFCFNRQENALGAVTMPVKKAEKIILAIASEGIGKVRFTGGEPLLHPKAMQLLSFAKKQGLEVVLNTNASLITKKKAERIAANACYALVSMHSLRPEKRVLNAANSLSEAGCDVRAATILSAQNITCLEKIHSAVWEMPFSQWVLLRQIPNALDIEPVSIADMRIAAEKLLALNAGRKRADYSLVENALPFCCSDPKVVSKIALGGIHEDGHSGLFVDANARIRPSYFFDVDLGSATEGRFLDAWKSDFMRRMNALEFIAEPCHKCKYVLKCMSGSRFAALFANKSLYALDPLAEPGNC